MMRTGIGVAIALMSLAAVSCGKEIHTGDGHAGDTTLNGTAIDGDNTRIGLITDSSTGMGIPGVPVTDGYSYTVTDAHGVYQFAAHEDARCVYISLPAAYEIPLAEDGEPSFWKTDSYRNDFCLTPRTQSWDDFSIVSFSDVHFWNTGGSSTDEVTKYRSRILPALNATVSSLDKVILLNTGDLVSNCTARLADSRTEFARIKKDGVTVPMFPTIGNHDFNNAYTSTLACSQDWFDVYGPLDYSFNIGKAHIVCLNNLQYAGNASGGYGKAMVYEKGITDAQWEWLQADLATVADKAGTLLILCVHAPVFNNDWAHAAELRGLLRTFGESHVISGHNHYNTHRQFTAGYNGLSGRLSKEHNQPPLGGLWRTALANDGSPMAYHVFSVSGNAVTRELFKAVDSPDASLQFRIYDGDATYHDALTDTSGNGNKDADDGLLHFDWRTLWESSADGDTAGKLIVRVFDAGTRGIDVHVYLTQGGVRTPMTHSGITHRDQCAFSFFWSALKLTQSWAQTYWQTKSQTYWYAPKPASGDWKVEVEFVESAGTRHYESSTLQTDYTGFAW